jgi:DNA repair photolyase
VRLVANPPNPYAGQYVDYLGPPPEARIEVYEEHARSILSHNDSPDISFSWSVNPYRGCQHACAYCYARRTHEYLDLGAGTDFDTRISVKINAPELLAAELANPKWKRETVEFSGVTDCYQPLEAVYRLTRGCLEVCAAASNPVGIVTKSYLIVRDLDVLQELQRRARVRVFLSIPFADAEAARLIEPHAPAPQRRFEAMRRLKEAGIPVGLIMAPIIPGLNDRDVPQVLEQAAEAGADFVTFAALRLPGSVRDVFLERLRAKMPDRARRVEQFIRDMRGGALNDARFGHRMRGSGVYWDGVKQLFQKTAARLGLRTGRVSPPSDRVEQGSPAAAPAAASGRQLPLFPG